MPAPSPRHAPRSHPQACPGLPWRPGFAALGPAFATPVVPTPLPTPCWVGVNTAVGEQLGLPQGWQHDDWALQAFSGNATPPGTPPPASTASVYSGHQFGVWAGQLGDGRALLLGELAGQEVQLKGSGRTPYSRMGDGRAVLRSSIREFLCSEAMHALGVPTTRALCMTGSPAPVYREEVETAAVVTRVAPSFIRFGHFEHFAARGQTGELRTLADYVIARHYPDCRSGTPEGSNAYAALLQAVSERTARLLAHWQAVGFCHGVMNTDNMSILGLTLDYGPFQFLDGYDPGHVCNHSDRLGRYAFDRQPGVALWNLHCLARALLPLIEDEQAARQALDSYEDCFGARIMQLLRAKLGLLRARDGDVALVDALLRLLAAERVDYPIFWRRLSHAVAGGDFGPVHALFTDQAAITSWLLSYKELLALDTIASSANLMLKTNPCYVLRNHVAEEVIAAAKLGDFQPLHTLQGLVTSPFDERPGHDAWAGFPPDWASHISISCSS